MIVHRINDEGQNQGGIYIKAEEKTMNKGYLERKLLHLEMSDAGSNGKDILAVPWLSGFIKNVYNVPKTRSWKYGSKIRG